MKIAILISRFLLGMGFIIFGLNILHPFMTSPPPPQGSLAAQFVAVMVPSHWIAFVGVLQLLGGLLLFALVRISWLYFEKPMIRRGHRYEYHHTGHYPGAGHAFFSVNRPAYRVEAANDGWQQIFAFYGKYLSA